MGTGAARTLSLRAGKQVLGYKERLLAFLTVYAKDSLPQTPELLAKYKGHEQDLFEVLGRKHGLTTTQALNVGACKPAQLLPPRFSFCCCCRC